MNITSIPDIPKTPSQGDEFGIDKYEKGLKMFLEHTGTPITIALQGEWGSGKTSLMQSLQHDLCEKGSFKGIWINTWEYSLMTDSFATLMNIITKILAEITSVTEKGVVNSKIVNKCKNVLGGLIKTGSSIVGANADSLVDAMFESNKESSVAELRKSIEEAIVKYLESNKQCRGFMFFIDDLDRINPPMAVELLEIMKNLFTLNNCVFVLAIDYDVVIKGLKPKFGELTDKNEREFRSFFDKIIQVPFSMPISKYDTGEFIIGELKNIGYVSTQEASRFGDQYKEVANLTVGNNPRSLKRLLNTVSLVKCICKCGDDQALNNQLANFLNYALIAVQVSYPKIYRMLELQTDFTLWGDVELKKLNVPMLTNQMKEHLKDIGGDKFDEPWEQTLYQVCESDYYLKQRAIYISDLFNLLRTIITSEAKPSEDECVSSIKEQIDKVFELSAVTNREANTHEVFEYNRDNKVKFMSRIYNAIHQELDARFKSIGSIKLRMKKNTGNGGIDATFEGRVHPAVSIFYPSIQDGKLKLTILNKQYWADKKYFKIFEGMTEEECSNHPEVLKLMSEYNNVIKGYENTYPGLYEAYSPKAVNMSGNNLTTYDRTFTIILDNEEAFMEKSQINTICDVVVANVKLHMAWEKLTKFK